MWADMMDVITCTIFDDCRLRGVTLVRGIILPSAIDLRYRPYNTGHTMPCDRVIIPVKVCVANTYTLCLKKLSTFGKL